MAGGCASSVSRAGRIEPVTLHEGDAVKRDDAIRPVARVVREDLQIVVDEARAAVERLDAAIRARSSLLDFLKQDASAKSPLAETAARMGTGAGGTRNIAGTNHPLVELERELADLHGKPAALVFTSGYVSNQTGIPTIAKLLPNCLILSDALNHNSMIEGVRQAGCDKQIFRHNDLAHLEELLQQAGDRHIQRHVVGLQIQLAPLLAVPGVDRHPAGDVPHRFVVGPTEGV